MNDQEVILAETDCIQLTAAETDRIQLTAVEIDLMMQQFIS